MIGKSSMLRSCCVKCLVLVAIVAQLTVNQGSSNTFLAVHLSLVSTHSIDLTRSLAAVMKHTNAIIYVYW